MILVASSISEVTELDYSADGAEFFKLSTTLNAQVMLNSLFETEGIDCSVSSAVATALLYGRGRVSRDLKLVTVKSREQFS